MAGNSKDDWNFSVEKPKKEGTRVTVRPEHKIERDALSLDTSSVPRNKTRSAMALELDNEKNKQVEEDVFHFASPIKRGIALLIDLLFTAGLVLASYFSAPLIRKLLQVFLNKYKLQFIVPEPTLIKVIFIGCLIMSLFCLVVVPVSFFNHTFGKKMTGLKVRGEERYTLTINEALKREIFFKPLSLLLVVGLFLPLFHKKRMSIHDMIMHTVVVDD